MSRNSIFRGCLAAALVCSAINAGAQPIAVREDEAQLQADEAALQREIEQLNADQATLRADTESGRMAAESKDAYAVYLASQWVKGERKDIAADEPGSRQMKTDEAALQRQMKQLQRAEARLEADSKAGRMAAESKDAERVYRDEQVVTAEGKQIAEDSAKLVSDEKR